MAGKALIRFVGLVERVRGETTTIHIFPQYKAGLRGIDGFSHLIILFWIHQRDDEKNRSTLNVVPRRHKGAPEMGVFGTRSPSRPNPIGLSVVELKHVKGCVLTVRGLDALEGSPVIDIKPYIPRADRKFRVTVPKWTGHGPST